MCPLMIPRAGHIRPLFLTGMIRVVRSPSVRSGITDGVNTEVVSMGASKTTYSRG